MNIYKGLLFLEGFRVLPEHVDDLLADLGAALDRVARIGAAQIEFAPCAAQ